MDKRVKDLRDRGALFILNHSGGKDSMAMTAYVRSLVPDSQLYVIHADLPEVDWPGCWDCVEATTPGLPRVEVVAGKTFLGMVRNRGMWPSPKYNQCTSDLKRGPINKEIRAECKRRGVGLVVNCMGMRAEESDKRAKRKAFKFDKRQSCGHRKQFDWLPIHEWTTAEVFARIAKENWYPHWVYAKGMTRLSCKFCIQASRSDLTVAAGLVPACYAKVCSLEREIGHTFKSPKKSGQKVWLPDYTGVSPVMERGQMMLPL